MDPRAEAEGGGGGLANYFTNTLESSFISRRGRPPVIRAAEKVRRQQGHFEYEDESRGMMIDYSDHHDYPEGEDYPEAAYREGSSTPVLDVGDEEYARENHQRFQRDRFAITEVGEGYSTHSENDEDYDINYGSGESGEEYMEMDQYPGHTQYSMCQPVYDSEEYSHSEGEAFSGDEFDREEELRGYNRAIDFTLHTILEESCEDSEPENKSVRDRKRHSDPSELEKYFFYGVGGGAAESNQQDDSECSEEHSEASESLDLPEKSLKDSKQVARENKMAALMESKITSRLEDYFMSGFSAEKHQSIDGISDRGNTDDSGSVGSESDGQTSPEHRRKKISRPKFRSERLSDRGESGAENNSNVEDEGRTDGGRADGHSSGEDNTAFVSGDGSFDTIKRKKNKSRKSSDDRRSDGERDVRRLSSSDLQQKLADSSGDVPSPTMTHQTIEVHHMDETKLDAKTDILLSAKNDKLRDDLSSKSEKKARDEPSSNKNSPSTSPPPVAGPVRKHKSRDSGFVGSNDDLLRNEGSNVVHTSSDETQGKNESSSEAETEPRKKRLEKVSEVSENTEDDCEKSAEPKLNFGGKMSTDGFPRKKSNESDISKDSDTVSLSRKDSFHQWSSDEETNIMMNRMRAFFKNMLANASKGKPVDSTRSKPTQVLHFEDQLTRLMRTVPGINEQQVKEIVEYLSSEDTWSDSYDSSDYTDYTSSDLEGLAHSEDADMPDLDVVIQEPVRPSNFSSADTDDFQKETAIMYQKLMNSVAKMQQTSEEKKRESEKKSPPITAKILQHISSRLVTLMHEVSGSENSSVSSSISDSRQNLYHTEFNPVTSSPKVEKERGLDFIKSDENENENNYTFDSLDSPKVLLGPNLGDPNQSNPFRFTKNTSKSVEILDLGPRRSSLDDKTIKLSMAKSTSTDLDVWRGVHRDVDERRGSLPRGHLDAHGSNSGVSDTALDDERFSWKGSFESALAADSRTRLSIEAKRRSVEYECGSEIFSSGEQMDRNISRNSSKSSLIPSRSPSQSSRRSNKSNMHSSRSSTMTRLEKERDTPTSEIKQYQDSDSDSASGSVSSSVRSSISSRYGRRSSVPEQQILARLSEDSPPPSPVPRPGQSHKSNSTAARHSTNSLPRLGTSAIQKNKSSSSTLISTSQSNGQPTNIQTSIQGGVRSARYRPHGYKPPPVRKSSTTSIGSQRKSSVDSLGRITDDNDVSSKSGTPSPMVSRVGGASTSDLRDLREGSVPRSVREGSVPRSVREGSAKRELREGSVGSNETNDGEDDRYRSNNLSSLGTRSESLASIYSQGEGRYGTVLVGGEVEFGYMYNQTTNSLDISIKQCKDLAPVDTKRNRSDPYVKVYLLPDRSKAGKRKTKVKKHTLNPVFEEILKFMMPMSEVERRTMWVSVWHSDMFGRNDFLGEVMMPMAGQVFDDPSSKWYTLQDRTEPPEEESLANSRGDIILALKYVPSENSRKERKKKGTLMLLVKEAKNIPLTRGNTLPDPYCKCYLLPDRAGKHKQKTGICRRTTSPRWEMTLTWEDLSLAEVAERSLEVSLWDHDRLGHHEQLGGVRLNLGTGKWGGRSAPWMDGQGREVTLWQQMLDRQNFWVEGSIPVRQLIDPARTEK